MHYGVKKLLRLIFRRRSRNPEVIQIAVTNRCNLACKMCPREYRSLPMKHMNMNDFRNILSKIPKAESFILHGYGESLLNENFFGMVSMINDKFPKAAVRFTTNGTLLTDSTIDKILNSRISRINISIDEVPGSGQKARLAHCRSADAVRGVKELARRRGRRKKPGIIIHSIITKHNSSDLFSVVELAGESGVDAVRLLRFHAWDKALNSLRPDSKQERQVFQRCKKIGADAGLGVKSSCNQSFFQRLLTYFDRFCIWADDMIYVDVDGSVFPCCMFTGREDILMGNLLTEDLSAIWRGKKFSEFFKHQHRHCSFCETLKYKQVY